MEPIQPRKILWSVNAIPSTSSPLLDRKLKTESGSQISLLKESSGTEGDRQYGFLSPTPFLIHSSPPGRLFWGERLLMLSPNPEPGSLFNGSAHVNSCCQHGCSYPRTPAKSTTERELMASIVFVSNYLGGQGRL